MDDFTPDTTRTGDAPRPRPRSAARRAMDEYADTGTWITTTVTESEADLVRRRLYTMAHKAGYGLRTEYVTAERGQLRLRMLVTTKKSHMEVAA